MRRGFPKAGLVGRVGLDDWDHGGFDIGYGNVDLVAT